MDNIGISIIIPVKNGRETLPSCLAGLRSQTLYHTCEIIVIDSGSTDGTIDFLKSQPDVRLYEIGEEKFNHGLTRNYGVSLARGNFIVMTVQDATPAENQWLEKMLSHFDDPSVDAVCGQQIVPHHRNKNPHEWFRPVSSPRVEKVQFPDRSEFEELSPEETKRLCSWDDVNAMYRKEVLLNIPFREAFFGEDAMWAKDALINGRSLIYDTSARVYHYHSQNFDYAYKRMLTQLYFGYKIFGFKRKNTFKASDYLKIVYRNFRYKAHPKWIWHNWKILWATNQAYYDFYKWLNAGESDLDNYYGKICETPPQGNS